VSGLDHLFDRGFELQHIRRAGIDADVGMRFGVEKLRQWLARHVRRDIRKGGVNRSEAMCEGPGLASVARQAREAGLAAWPKLPEIGQCHPDERRRNHVFQQEQPRKVAAWRVVAPRLTPTCSPVRCGEPDQHPVPHRHRAK